MQTAEAIVGALENVAHRGDLHTVMLILPKTTSADVGRALKSATESRHVNVAKQLIAYSDPTDLSWALALASETDQFALILRYQAAEL